MSQVFVEKVKQFKTISVQADEVLSPNNHKSVCLCFNYATKQYHICSNLSYVTDTEMFKMMEKKT